MCRGEREQKITRVHTTHTFNIAVNDRVEGEQYLFVYIHTYYVYMFRKEREKESTRTHTHTFDIAVNGLLREKRIYESYV